MSDAVGSSSSRRPLLESLEPRLLLDAAGEEQALELFSTAPAVFAENRGQWADAAIRYAFDGAGANVGFTAEGPVFQVFRREPVEDDGSGGEGTGENAEGSDPALLSPLPGDPLGDEQEYVTQGTSFSVHFDGANPTEPVGLDPAETRFNYFLGDQSQWREGVPTYETIRYEGLYDGIDLYTWGRRDSLKYEFHVAPGADYRDIRVSYSGIDGLSLDADGALHVETELGGLVDAAPVIYQEAGGERSDVAGHFRLVDEDTYTFQITGPYDASRELVIDPDLAWSTYLGGGAYERAFDVAIDGSGLVYISGETTSENWISSEFESGFNGVRDAFVAKLSSAGGHLWSSYLGGSRRDEGRGITVDSGSNVLVTGETESANWTSGGFDTSHGGGNDGFLCKLSPAGGHLWSTYLGGGGSDACLGVAVGAGENILITGVTASGGWTSGGFDTSFNGGVLGDAFVAKLSRAGAHLWSTYIGGRGDDLAYDIAVDSGENGLVTGWTRSAGWTSGGFDTTYNGGGRDAFACKLSSSGGHFWSTYLGGGEEDRGRCIAVDSYGNALVAGDTYSAGWASGGFDTTYGGWEDGFLAKVSSAGGHIWSTYLGGGDVDGASGVATDSSGNVLAVGATASAGWVSGGVDTTYNGGYRDAFVVKVSQGGAHIWSSYLGGSKHDRIYAGIAVDAGGNCYVSGETDSSGWVSGGFDTKLDGGYDAFVAKIGGGEGVNLADLAVSESGLALAPEGRAQRVTATVHNVGSLDAADVAVRFRDPDSGWDTTQTIPSIAPFASETCSVLWTPSGPGARIEVTADPWNDIEEETETNNAAVARWEGDGTLAPPDLASVDAIHDGNGNETVFGRFVSGIELWNTFEAATAGPVHHVDFTLGPLGTQTDDDLDGGWTAEFNVGALAEDAALQVIAYADAGELYPSEIWTGTVDVADPGWMIDGFTGTFDAAGGTYHISARLPEELGLDHTFDPEIFLLGGRTNHFGAGLAVDVETDLAATYADVDASLFFDLTLLDQEIWNWESDVPLSLTPADGLTVGLEVDPADLHLVGTLDAHLDLSNFAGVEVRPGLPPWDAASRWTATGNPMVFMKDPTHSLIFVPALEHRYPIVVGVPIGDVGLSAGLSVELGLDFGLSAAWDFADAGLEIIQDDTYGRVDLETVLTLRGEARLLWGLGTGAFIAEPTLGLHYQANLGYPPLDVDTYPWGDFRIPFRVVGSALWGLIGETTLYENIMPNNPPGSIGPEDKWVFGSPPPGGAGASEPTLAAGGESTAVPLLPEPLVSAASDGRVLFARLVDADGSESGVASELAYAFRDAGGTWSALETLTGDAQAKFAPAAGWTSGGEPVLVWAQSTVDTADPPDTVEAVLASVEIYSARYDDAAAAWTTPAAVTANGVADGGPSVAFDATSANGLVVWSTLAGGTDGWDLSWAAWDDATGSWGPAAALATGASEDTNAKVVCTPSGDAVAVWLRGTRSGDDLVSAAPYYAVWDGASATWSAPAAMPDDGLAFAASVDAAALSDGRVLAVWTADADGGDALLSSVWDPASGTWSAAETTMLDTVVDRPVLVVDDSDVATIVFHGREAGRETVLAATRDMGVPGDPWRSVRQVKGDETAWSPSAALDADGELVLAWSTHELLGGGSAMTTATEAGSDGFGQDVAGLTLPVLPDVAATAVALDADPPVSGQETLAWTTVTNEGLVPSEAFVVQFYLGDPDAGGVQIGGDVPVDALEPGAETLVVSPPLGAPAAPETLYAVAVHGGSELDTGNNRASVEVVPVPPDLTGPQVVLDAPGCSLFPDSTSVLGLAFDEPVRQVGEPHISLVEATEGVLPPDHVYLSPDGQEATLIFEGGLPAGDYTFKVRDSVTDEAGNPLDGDADGTPGEDFTMDLTVQPLGDMNGDGAVDDADDPLLIQALAAPDAYAAAFPDRPADLFGDLNRDGVFDGGDIAIDVADAHLVTDYLAGGTNPHGQVADLVASGYAGGAWDGPGIRSSAAAAETDHLTAVGVLDNADPHPALGGKTDLGGVPVDTTSVLAAYTYYGDGNLDRTVNIDDLNLLEQTWAVGPQPDGSAVRWGVGDFDFDGDVDIDDLNLLERSWALQGGALSATGPRAAPLSPEAAPMAGPPESGGVLTPETALPLSRKTGVVKWASSSLAADLPQTVAWTGALPSSGLSGLPGPVAGLRAGAAVKPKRVPPVVESRRPRTREPDAEIDLLSPLEPIDLSVPLGG